MIREDNHMVLRVPEAYLGFANSAATQWDPDGGQNTFGPWNAFRDPEGALFYVSHFRAVGPTGDAIEAAAAQIPGAATFRYDIRLREEVRFAEGVVHEVWQLTREVPEEQES